MIFATALVERIISEEFPFPSVPVEGEISGWISRFVGDEPIEIMGFKIGDDVANRFISRMFPMILRLFDPRKAGQAMAEVLNSLPVRQLRQLEGVVDQRDWATVSPVFERCLEIVAPGRKADFASFFGLIRAAHTYARCLALYKQPPLLLIERARQGDRRAVLDLVKLDNLFLRDSSTAAVIQDATFRNDHSFLKQLARAQANRPRASKHAHYRVILYCLFALGVDLPSNVRLFAILDPNGKAFGSFEAFEKFVERSRRELDDMRSAIQGG